MIPFKELPVHIRCTWQTEGQYINATKGGVMKDNNDEKDYKCCMCGEECGIVEETFDYGGTHCTHGNAGTHHTGIYVSSCCLADYEEI